MESILESKNFEVDITRDECFEKKKSFFSCVIERKSELTESISDNDWPNYHQKVYNISRQCYDDKGLKKCKPFFSFQDISY